MVITLEKDIFENFSRTRSTGSYSRLYSITHDRLIQRSLIKYFNPESDKIDQLVNLFYDLLELFGYDRGQEPLQYERHMSAYDKLKWSFNCYVWIYGSNTWVELFKWKTSAFFACIFNACNIPKTPRDCDIYKNPFKLFFGRAQKFLLRMTKDNHEIKLFANSVLMLKKGAPAVNSDMILEKRVETYKQLITAPPVPEILGDYKVVRSTQEIVMTDIHAFSIKYEDIGWERIDHESVLDYQVPRTVEYSEGRLTYFIEKVVKEVFGGRRLTSDVVFEYSFPSLSANYNWSRKSGGGLGEVNMRLGRLKRTLISEYLSDDGFGGHDLFDPGFSGFVYNLQDDDFTKKAHLKKCYFGDCVRQQGKTEGLCIEYDDTELHAVYKYAFEHLIQIALNEEPKTATVGLPEPLKVRVITKGPPTTYFVLKRIQKFLWKTLKNHPTFRLIGEPLTEEIVNAVFGRTQEWVLSGDYKASTDNIYSWLSEFTCDKLFEVLKVKEEDSSLIHEMEILTKRALTGHWIQNPLYSEARCQKPSFYGKRHSIFKTLENVNGHRATSVELVRSTGNALSLLKDIKKGFNISKCGNLPLGDPIYNAKIQLALQDLKDDFDAYLIKNKIEKGAQQQQGQLMGSVVSFPFLCIINCAVCWMALSADKPELEFVRLEDLPLLVNGDDCVFVGTSGLESHWEKSIRYVGFSSSVGKTYFSKELLVMNSMTFFKNKKKKKNIESQEDEYGWALQKYINFGLVSAVNKAGEQQENVFAYASIQKDLLEKTPDRFKESVNRLFFRNHMGVFKDSQLPFYMPQWSGGLGLTPPPDHDTFMDRKILSSRIMSGEDFRSPPKADEWKIDSHIKKLMSELGVLGKTYETNMTVENREVDLESKEFYSALLCLTLLSSQMEEFYFEGGSLENKTELYIKSMKYKWRKPIHFDEGIRVRTLLELTERIEPKQLDAVILSSRA